MSKVITSSSHGKGNTCMAFSKDGQRAFTGGQDCIVRIWKVNEGSEQEPSTAAEAEDAVTCVAAADDYWFSGSEDTEVRRYLPDSNQFDAPLTSVAGVPIRYIAVDPTGKRVAVASDELFVKVVDIEDSGKVTLLQGYTSGVRSATWHPSGALLATCTCDGKIVIWNMSGEQPAIEKTIEGVIPAVVDTESPEFSSDCSVVWHTSGQYFFVATKGHEIITISRSDWSKASTFTDKNVSGTITALALSPNGVYIASASQSKVHVWSTQTRRVMVSQIGNPGSTITQIHFSPRENLLAWTDTDGVFSRWSKPISDNFPDPVKAAIGTNGAATIPLKPKTGLDLFADDLPAGGTSKEAGIGDDVDLDDDMLDVDDGWIVDDMDGAFQAEPQAQKNVGFVKEMVSITKAQPPFQPGSTPFENKKRYLAYNMIGVIEVTDQDTHNIINVDFFDKSLRKGYHFTDSFKYNLGYLGERGAVFACQPENDHAGEVMFKPYTSWKTHDWSYSLSRKGTRCLGIAAGALPLTSKNNIDIELEGYGNIIVATSENDLTFLSGTGRERRIMALPGEFVTMVATAEWVFVVHRAGSTTIDGSQNLHYTIINFEDFSVRQRDILPVPKGHTLKWIGLTDLGAPAMYDSTGCINVLTKYRIPHHASWARIMDTNLLERRQGKDESYWPVGITESNLMCLILKGRQEYPSFPRPLIQELPMQIPFRNVSSQEDFIERETLLVQTILDSLDEELTNDDIIAREKAMDRELIQLVQSACKNNKIARAIELVKLLHNTVIFDSIVKIADFYHLAGLKEKIEIMKADREEAEDRLIFARSKRRRWLKPDPPLRQLADSSSSARRFDPLADTRPPLPIERPGMARVTVPIIETTRYSSHSSQPPDHPGWGEGAVADSPPPLDTKRKRAEIDESFPSSDFSMLPPAAKQKTFNPFSRKNNQEAIKTPFSRRTESRGTIQKSESFFEKAEKAVDSETGSKKPRISAAKGKTVEKKEAPKQTTLFGTIAKSDKPSKPKKKVVEQETQEQETQIEETQVDETQIDSQMTDVTMEDLGVETQEERQGSPDWDETQLLDESLSTSQMVASEV